ncbi:MAG: porin family protein [Alphaproteobacteria bacterium]|nr:porin family protein [Alphaproteobacteria bacterium]
MRSGILAACVLCLAISSPAAAQQSIPGANKPYFGLLGGITIAPDEDIDGANGLSGVSSQETGFAFGGVAGYKFGFGPRIEAEFMYRRNRLSSLQLTNDGGLGTALGFGDLSGTTVSTSGTLWSMSGMLNGWFDFHITPAWVPYVGGGAGFTHASISNDGSSVVLIDGSDSNFSAQAGAGIAFIHGEFLTFSLDYRYLRTLELDFQDSVTGSTVNATYQTHNIMFTIRGAF